MYISFLLLEGKTVPQAGSTVSTVPMVIVSAISGPFVGLYMKTIIFREEFKDKFKFLW